LSIGESCACGRDLVVLAGERPEAGSLLGVPDRERRPVREPKSRGSLLSVCFHLVRQPFNHRGVGGIAGKSLLGYVDHQAKEQVYAATHLVGKTEQRIVRRIAGVTVTGQLYSTGTRPK
jgi:hypothetical protein